MILYHLLLQCRHQCLLEFSAIISQQLAVKNSSIQITLLYYNNHYQTHKRHDKVTSLSASKAQNCAVCFISVCFCCCLPNFVKQCRGTKNKELTILVYQWILVYLNPLFQVFLCVLCLMAILPKMPSKNLMQKIHKNVNE